MAYKEGKTDHNWTVYGSREQVAPSVC